MCNFYSNLSNLSLIISVTYEISLFVCLFVCLLVFSLLHKMIETIIFKKLFSILSIDPLFTFVSYTNLKLSGAFFFHTIIIGFFKETFFYK